MDTNTYTLKDNHLWLEGDIKGVYKEYWNEDSSILQSSFMYDEIQDLYQDVLNKYGEKLTSFQCEMLLALFTWFDTIQEKIDPNRLKAFKVDYNPYDEELIFYRKSNYGLTNLAILDDEMVVGSYIPSSKNERSVSEEYYTEDDLESAAFFLFSK